LGCRKSCGFSRKDEEKAHLAEICPKICRRCEICRADVLKTEYNAHMTNSLVLHMTFMMTRVVVRVVLFFRSLLRFIVFCLFISFQDLEKKLEIVTEENSKLKQLAKSQVENIIEPAAKHGDVGAIQVVGECYQHGLGGKKKDEKQAIEFYEKGVSANSPSSQVSLGLLLDRQKNDRKANERAIELFKKSAKSGYPRAQHVLALKHCNGTLVQEDKNSAIELFKEAASNGYVHSYYRLGQCFQKGLGGVQKDAKEAEKWYLKAAEFGEVKSQLNLGCIYANDEKMKDATKAIEWLEKVYYNGSVTEAQDAAEELELISEGEGAYLDKAIGWAYRGQQYINTGFLLGKKGKRSLISTMKGLYRTGVHETGNGTAFSNLACVALEPFKIVLFRRSALLGSSNGQFQYGSRLPNEHPDKLKYLHLAAASESQDLTRAEAQWELGLLDEMGRCGMEKNSVLAKEWKDKALANGYKPPG
jgi:TPR repeat protein